MPASGFIAAVASALRPGSARGKAQQPVSNASGPAANDTADEETGLLGSSTRRISPETQPAPLDPAYGTLPHYTGSSAGIYPATTPAAADEHADHDDALDGNDAAVWQDVRTGGLDGRGSIAETEEADGDERERRRGDKWDDEQAMLQDVTYRRLVLKYLSVPLVALLALALLAMLARYAWPPTPPQRRAGAPYPHPFLHQPFLVGIFTSLSVQALRAPVFDVLQSAILGFAGREAFGPVGSVALLVLSIVAHTTAHELLRLLSLPLICSGASPFPATAGIGGQLPATALLQLVFHLALGWGAAEAAWGIGAAYARGIRLYADVMRRPTPRVVIEGMGERGGPARSLGADRGVSWWRRLLGRSEVQRKQSHASDVEGGSTTPPRQVETDGRHVVVAEDFGDTAIAPDSDSEAADEEEEEREEEDLERKIEMLERIKGRRDLEAVLGRPFPNIPLVLHFLWRIDTLLLNLGLTLFVSAYYFNAEPIYPPSHAHQERPRDDSGSRSAISIHSIITIAWNLGVRKLGVGAVSWSSLILSLATVFAGIGAWGGLV